MPVRPNQRRWRRIEKLFHAAAERPSADRRMFLEHACRGDRQLASEVQSLLEQRASNDRLLSTRPTCLVEGAAATSSQSWLGRTLGVYEVVSFIGAGGMGEVYRARDSRLGRNVALKLPPQAFSKDPDQLARFEQEAAVLASLNHPNIVTIYGVVESDGVRALILELIDGETLAERIAHGPIPVAEALAIARQIADALDCVHERRIIHRDLKPANIKVRRDGRVKILDFGLATAMETIPAVVKSRPFTTLETMPTGGGDVAGTAAYMSPEQVKGQPADKRNDIWAFGCVLYEMVTGCQAFRGHGIFETLIEVVMRNPDWNMLPANLSHGGRLLLKRCLNKDPRHRFRDIADVRLALDDVVESQIPVRGRSPGYDFDGCEPVASGHRSSAGFSDPRQRAGFPPARALHDAFRTAE